MTTVTVTVQDFTMAMLTSDQETALGLALYDDHFVEHVEITWWRPVDKMERHIKFTGDLEIIQPVVAMMVEFSKLHGGNVSVLKHAAEVPRTNPNPERNP